MTKPRFPQVIDEWPRSNRESLRVFLDRYQGRNVVHLRAFYSGPDGEPRGGRDGIALGLVHLPKLARAFGQALKEAQALGLLPEGGEDDAAP